MTTFISVEALSNYKKLYGKQKVKKEIAKENIKPRKF